MTTEELTAELRHAKRSLRRLEARLEGVAARLDAYLSKRETPPAAAVIPAPAASPVPPQPVVFNPGKQMYRYVDEGTGQTRYAHGKDVPDEPLITGS